MHRKTFTFLLIVIALMASLLPATALAQDPDNQETLLEQSKALAAEQNPTAPEAPAPLYFGEGSTHPLFVGVDDITVPAYQVDVVTNGFLPAFSGFQVWGSAYDPVNDKVYFNNGSTLYEWPVGGSATTLGTIVDPAGATQSMVGLAFYNGQLYGIKNIANEAIWAIDTTTLVATVHIDYTDADFDLGGFSADPNTGEFYATNDDTTPNGSGLFRINPDGTGTLITPYPAGQTDIDGLAVSDDGFAYLVTDEPGFIYVWDFTGGAYATPLNNPWTTSEIFSAGAWIWEQGQGGVCPSGPESGEMTANDPVFNRPVGFGVSCSLSGVGTAVHYKVHSFNLAGAPPHDLFASLVGGTTMDTVLVFYQAPDGSANPFDPTQGCLNSVAYNDDFGGTLQSQISATGLGEGWVDVVVTTFDNGVTGAYTMDMASQSCQSGGGTPNIDVDPLSMSANQPTNTTTQQTLDVGNTGTADLTWTIAEEPAVVVPLGALEAEMLKADGSALPTPDSGATGSRGGSSGADAPIQYTSPADFSEAFDDITNLPGWAFQNNSSPLGLTDWFQGNDQVFPAHAGAPTAYIGANFNNTSGTGDISNWMMTPEISLANGDTISFWTRTADGSTWPDRVELRLSTAGSSTNVGATAASVGDFTTLLLSINPTLVAGGYPETWTQYSVTLSGIPAGATGRIAWRYFVTGGGPNGANSNYIGIDTVEYVSGGEPQVCDAPSAVPWLSVSPSNGTTAPAAITPVDVTFDSTGLAAGVYTANLCIDSNDPDAGPGNETELVIVPVELTVTEPREASIVITKTVGLVSGVCATTSTLDVAAGTTVYYCYTVTNTGDVTLNDHDLVDDQLGTIFTGLNYALTPGSSVNTVAAGLTIPAVINATTTNVATWTAAQSSTGGLTATATATATVNVAETEIVKTVGTDPLTCAADTTITVPAGTTVYYCYTVTNTGDVTLNLHDLDDDQLGNLFTGFPYALTPGSSVSTVDAGLTIPAFITAPTTNTAIWTAYNADDYVIDDTVLYNWEDISATGTPVALGDDEVSGAIPVGFAFDYYGMSYSDIYISSNGFLTVLTGQDDGCCTGQPIPTSGDPDGVIAGWWEDLNPQAGGGIYYQTLGATPNRVFIVQFSAVPHFGGGNAVSMQFKLYESSNVIEVHYEIAPSDGGTHSAGVENEDGTVGVEFYRGAGSIGPRVAVRYTPAGVSVTAEASAFVDVIYFSCQNPEEDFENGVPAWGWSVVNNAGGASWGNIAACGESGSGGNYTGGLGDAACMSPGSLTPGAYDAEMRTPVFSLVGYSNATISYLANYQNWGGIDRLNFDISMDGGVTWTTLRTWNSDQGAFQNTPGVFPTVDLADYLGMSNLMLRWHYFWNDPQALGWYAQIDDAEFKCVQVPPTAVTLDGLSATPAAAAGSLSLLALPAVISLALGAAYVLRRKE